MDDITLSIECCEWFPKMIERFEWFSFDENGKKVLCMPHFNVSEDLQLRVNHCPSCGKEVRGIEIRKK